MEKEKQNKREMLKSMNKITKHIDGLTYEWGGGHGVHIYDSQGKEIEYFSVGDFSKDNATPREVSNGIKRWHKEQYE